jgi:periplasmic divalent cation tolerance protein
MGGAQRRCGAARMTDIALVYALFPDEASARNAACTVVSERLAACANLLAPCTSFYEWGGEMTEASEIPALFKTTATGAEALIARIAELHSYEVPAILSWAAGAAHPPFAQWVHDQTRK